MAFNASNFGQVINISQGGLLYKSLMAQGEPSHSDSFNIGLLNSAEGHYLDQLPCRIVHVEDSSPLLPTSNTIIRESSIQFIDLSTAQKQHLQSFLDKNTMGLA